MSAVVLPLARPAAGPAQTVFDRAELGAIFDLYGHMVAAGLWRDYALEFGRDHAVFAAFRRASERPQAQLWKRPALRARQGMYALVGEGGLVLRRGQALAPVLMPLRRALVKLVHQR